MGTRPVSNCWCLARKAEKHDGNESKAKQLQSHVNPCCYGHLAKQWCVLQTLSMPIIYLCTFQSILWLPTTVPSDWQRCYHAIAAGVIRLATKCIKLSLASRQEFKLGERLKYRLNWIRLVLASGMRSASFRGCKLWWSWWPRWSCWWYISVGSRGHME